MSDTDARFLMVNSRQLSAAAETVRRRRKPQVIPTVGVRVTARQLDAAAGVLRAAEPTVCNGNVSERPGFIVLDRPGILAMDVGILPSTRYRFDSRGVPVSGGDEGNTP